MDINHFSESVLISVISAFVAAALTASLSLRRFSNGKIWERKAAAYTVIFEALHDMSLLFEKEQKVTTGDTNLSRDEYVPRHLEHVDAQALLVNKVQSESWLLPDDCRKRLDLLMSELEERHEWWHDFIKYGHAAIQSSIIDLRSMVRKDLGLKRRL
jgi:hypothetical protein